MKEGEVEGNQRTEKKKKEKLLKLTKYFIVDLTHFQNNKTEASIY